MPAARRTAVRRRWGYRRLTVLLRREGIEDNHKRIYRLYRAEVLQVRKRRRRKQRLVRGTERPPAPQRPNERWSLDFVHDRLANGRALRLLTVHDDYTRECLWIFLACCYRSSWRVDRSQGRRPGLGPSARPQIGRGTAPGAS